MKRSLSAFVLALALIPVACSGGETHEAVGEESMIVLEDVIVVLEGITDKASAEAAKPELEALAERGRALKKRMDALGEPDEATKKALEEKFNAKGQELQGRMMKAVMQLANPEIQAVLQETMSKLNFGN